MHNENEQRRFKNETLKFNDLNIDFKILIKNKKFWAY